VTQSGAVLVLAFGGFLLGGAWSLRQQRRPWWAVAVTALLGVMFMVGGVLNLWR
jgi:hypothetical protein